MTAAFSDGWLNVSAVVENIDRAGTTGGPFNDSAWCADEVVQLCVRSLARVKCDWLPMASHLAHLVSAALPCPWLPRRALSPLP